MPAQQLQSASAFRDPRNAAAQLFSAQADATRTAAGNAGGAALGFMGMNIAQQTGGNAAQLYQMGQQQAVPMQQAAPMPQQAAPVPQQVAPTAPSAPAAAPAEWACPSCGTRSTGRFCPECGTPRPQVQAAWTCPTCGATGNKGRFCGECGTPRP